MGGLLRYSKIVVGYELFEIGEKVSVRDHGPGGLTGRSGRVLQIRRARVVLAPDAGSCRGVKIQQVNLNDRWSGCAGLRLNMPGDGACDRGRREQ